MYVCDPSSRKKKCVCGGIVIVENGTQRVVGMCIGFSGQESLFTRKGSGGDVAADEDVVFVKSDDGWASPRSSSARSFSFSCWR